ncbi:MAG TPA: hypothetical protein GX697_02665 [Firmicutes bacterium]|nr:hypothetical protein [Bacillota bacterium]
MAKAKYPGVDYSDHGIAGNNPNTMPGENREKIKDTLAECLKLAQTLENSFAAGKKETSREKFSALARELNDKLKNLENDLGV